MLVIASCCLALALVVPQPGIEVSDGSISAPAATGADATAFVALANRGMYDVYLVSASSEIAERVEFVQFKDGKPAPLKEVPIPAFDRLEMAAGGTYLKLVGLKKPIARGDRVSITLHTDDGTAIVVTATAQPR